MLDALQSHPWAYPLLEAIHITGIAMLLGNLLALELRVFGWGAVLPVRALARLCLSLTVAGFVLAAGTGVLMFATQPAELLANRAFTLKMLLLFAAGCNAAIFHSRRSLDRLDRTARLLMVSSTLIWLAVILCGRSIAYR